MQNWESPSPNLAATIPMSRTSLGDSLGKCKKSMQLPRLVLRDGNRKRMKSKGWVVCLFCARTLSHSCSNSLSRFLRLWIAVLVIYPTNQAVIALTFANYILQPIFPTCLPPETGLRLMAGVCLCKY